MNHSKKILFVILTIILISLIICLPNIKNMYNVNKEKEKYLKLIQENKILLNEINKLTKRVNEIEENYNFVANAKEYKKQKTAENNA